MTILVCVGSACHIKGSYNIIHQLQHIIEEKQLEEKVVVQAALCLGKCTKAVSVMVDNDEIISLSAEEVRDFFEKVVMEKLKNV